MAKKFHIRDDGSVGKCDARFRRCPVGQAEDGTEAPHFPTPEAAREAYEASMAAELDASLEADRAKDLRDLEDLQDLVARTIPDLGTRESSKRVRIAMEAVDSDLTPELVEAWSKEKKNSPKYRMAKHVADYRSGRFTEGQLANLLGDAGSTAYEEGYANTKRLVVEKVEHDHAEAIRAEKSALFGSLQLEDPSYEYDRVAEKVVSAEDRQRRSEELQSSIDSITADMPLYLKLWKSYKASDKEDSA